MSPITGLLSSPTGGGWLVLLAEATLKGTVVLLCAMALVFALREARASLRHLVWSLALVGMLVIPALSFVIPHWTLPLIPAPVSVSAQGAGDEPRYFAAPDPLITGDRAVSAVEAANESPRSRSTIATSTAAATDSQSVRSSATTLALIWLAGLVACLLATAFSASGLRALAGRATRINDLGWLALLESLKRELELEREVLLLLSPHASMPATWGVTRPVILLPAEASEWTAERKRVVLLHELAHIQRLDCLTQLAAQICCALYWFHPGVWYVALRMRTERELACDEQVLVLGVNACDYADHLLDIARSFRTPVSTRMAAVAMARPSQLEGRLLAILNGDVARKGAARTVSRALAFGVLIAVIVPLAAMRPWRDAPVSPLMPHQSEPARQLAEEAQPSSMVAVGDTFRWKGRTFQGQWISIRANYGEIRAVITDGNEAEVIAVRKTPGGPGEVLRMHVDTRRRGFGVCVLPVTSLHKTCDDAFMTSDPPTRARIDFLVRVPAGVGFGGHTATGNVAAEGLRGYAWGTAVKGDISLETTDLAEASTRSGSISASFGRANWTGDLEFETGNGDVTVTAPANSSAMVQVETNRGRVRSDFPLNLRRSGNGDYRTGRIGTGKAMLTLRTGNGNVELRRGTDGVFAPDVNEYASGSGVDPKPNPNPDVDFDPDPNPIVDPNPNPYPLSSWRGPASDLDQENLGSPDNPTGEKVPFTPPADLITRVSNARIRSALDREAIVRLRDIAVIHQKQHPADFVKERSLWALSQVREGRLIQPLVAALSNPDWRVRAYAAWALASTGESSGVPALVMAMNDPHYRVRMHAVYGLELGGTSAVPTLIKALRDPHWQIRIGAVDALTTIDDARAIEPLRALRQDQHPLVREEVVQALGKLER